MRFSCGNASSVFENHQHWSPASGENWILLSQSSCGLLQRHVFSSGSQKSSCFSCLREIPGYLIKLCGLLLTHRNKFPMLKVKPGLNIFAFILHRCLPKMSRVTHLVWEEKGQWKDKGIPGLFQCSVVKQSLEVHRRDSNLEEFQIPVLTQLQWFQLSLVGKSNAACGANSLWDFQNG